MAYCSYRDGVLLLSFLHLLHVAFVEANLVQIVIRRDSRQSVDFPSDLLARHTPRREEIDHQQLRRGRGRGRGRERGREQMRQRGATTYKRLRLAIWWWVRQAQLSTFSGPASLFLDASTHLYKRLCLSVRRSICWSVGRSVRR